MHVYGESPILSRVRHIYRAHQPSTLRRLFYATPYPSCVPPTLCCLFYAVYVMGAPSSSSTVCTISRLLYGVYTVSAVCSALSRQLLYASSSALLIALCIPSTSSMLRHIGCAPVCTVPLPMCKNNEDALLCIKKSPPT